MPCLPDAVFPEWSGTDDARASAIGRSVADVRYARQANSLDELRAHDLLGEYDGAFIIAPLRQALDEAS